ncbi:MAG: glycosyltransferase family 4 protein [Halanaerobiales bacterium]
MNILVLTSVYPQPDYDSDLGNTPVVHYFAKEWVKIGHNVTVIHLPSKYPKLLYLLPFKWIKKITSFWGVVVPKKNQNTKIKNIKDDVIIYRIPLLRIMPRKKFSDKKVINTFNEIKMFLKKNDFEPDIVLGHWENPQIPLLSMFKKYFKLRTALIFHGIVYINQKRYKDWAKEQISNIDVIGARSKAISKEVKDILSLNEDPFICYSGIPDKYFNSKDFKTIRFDKKVSDSYLYVGRLIARKNVNSILLALNGLYKNSKWIFNIIGEGIEKDNLISLKDNLNLDETVQFLGYKNRDKVLEFMKKTEVFIMISDNETFGLVYIEAMSKGCIVIASKDSGMDGIIINGYNGFLCEQGNEQELECICKQIREMSLDEKVRISKNAVNTANRFKDSVVANNYLNQVLE